MPPKPHSIVGWDPVSDDEKTKKKSRRKGKGSSNDEPTKAGPSSTVALSSSSQPSHGTGSSASKPPASTLTVRTPASTVKQQPTQIPNQNAPATSYTIQPARTSAQTSNRSAGQASSQPVQPTLSTRPVDTPSSAGKPSSQGSSAPSDQYDASSASKVSPGAVPSKGTSSASRDGGLDIFRLKGQPPRPNPDSKALNRVSLASNYFELTRRHGLKLWHYVIIVTPEIKGPKLTQIIKTALNSDIYAGLKSKIVTDFSAIMLSIREIPPECQNFKIRYKSELETEFSENAKEYKITLDPIGLVDLSNPGAYLQHTETDYSGLPIEQAFDIILGHHRKMSDDVVIVHKRKAFSINANANADANGYESCRLDTSSVLTALRGYFSSVRISQSSILVNINVSHGAFYTVPSSLTQVVRYLKDHCGIHASKVPGLLRGLRVSSSHIQRVWSIWGYPKIGDGRGYMLHPPKFTSVNTLEYTPNQVRFFHSEKPKDSSTTQAQTLNERDKERARDGKLTAHGEHCGCPGKWLTVAEYFAQVRGQPIPLQYIGLPLINVGSNRRPTYLPSHLCQVRPGQISNLKLGQEQIKNMIRFAVRTPDANAQSILTKGFNTLGLIPSNQELNAFGVTVTDRFVQLKGRSLNKPTLVYGAKKIATTNGSTWNLTGLSFHTPKKLNNWACTRIYQNPEKDFPVPRLRENFEKNLGKKGIIVEQNSNHGDLQLKRNDYHQDLKQWFEDCHRADINVKFMIMVLPENPTSELYNSIKRFGDIECGIHTVCVKAGKFGSVPYDDNVALKINLKLGGTNHVLKEGALGPIFEVPTMVVGIDVTHPAPGEEGAPSVAAMVASIDMNLSQWPADLRINKRRQEIVMMLREMLTTRLVLFGKSYGELPTNILIYRDGVGEGQYKIILEEEMPRLRDACRSVYGKDYQEGVCPRITLVVVGKRHHTRFFKTAPNSSILSGNASRPPAGTLVDQRITQDCNWDFYLQSHTAFTGTPRPAHYFVLVDEIFRQTTAEPVTELERLTYNMCYLYGKATTSVSIPPPVYYADKACDRGRRYLSRVFDQGQIIGDAVEDSDVRINDKLKNSMFYI